MKRALLALILMLCIAVAPSAFSCEKCEWDKLAKVYKCKSGVRVGVDTCWGGFNGTEYCEVGGACEEPERIAASLPPQQATNGVLGAPAGCKDCRQDAPAGGFVLE